MKTRQIIFNGSYFSKKPTGISVVSEQLAKYLNQNLLSLYAPFPVGNSHFIKLPDTLDPELGLRAHIKRLYWTQYKLSIILKNNKDSILFSPLPEAPLVKNTKSIVLVHDLMALRLKNYSLLYPYHRFYVPLVLKNASKVLCNSNETATEVKQILKIPDKKIEIIKLGFNNINFIPSNITREPFLLIIARHSPNKNLPRILKAFSLFRNLSRSYSNYKLKIVGSFDKRFTPKYKKLAAELDINEYCEWLNWVSEDKKIKLLNSCKALVIGSLWEGFGLPALEALSCGTPVIATNRGAVKEILGNKGILVNPYNPKSIAEAMYEIVNNKSIEMEFRNYGPIRAKEYSWRNTARKIENIIFSI